MGGGGILQGDGAEEVAQEAEGRQGQDAAGHNAIQLGEVARILSLCSRIILGSFKYVTEDTLHVVTCFKTYLYVEQHKIQFGAFLPKKNYPYVGVGSDIRSGVGDRFCGPRQGGKLLFFWIPQVGRKIRQGGQKEQGRDKGEKWCFFANSQAKKKFFFKNVLLPPTYVLIVSFLSPSSIDRGPLIPMRPLAQL